MSLRSNPKGEEGASGPSHVVICPLSDADSNEPECTIGVSKMGGKTWGLSWTERLSQQLVKLFLWREEPKLVIPAHFSGLIRSITWFLVF